MGRKAGPIKWTKVFRVTPDEDKKIDEILKHDLMWDAKQCLEYGLIDEII